jgi:uncharacterized protein YjiS (DUF1127 family)
MTDHAADHFAAEPRGLRALVAALRRRLAEARAAARRYDTLRQLSLLDEAMLRDVGLSRADLERMRHGAPIERSTRRGVRVA